MANLMEPPCVICVGKGDDGYFQAANINDRIEVLLILKTISYGQFYEEVCLDNDLEELDSDNADTLADDEWLEYLQKFEHKGQFQLLNI